MQNKLLMKKLVELYFKPLKTREESFEVMTKFGIIKRAFGVKDFEIEIPENSTEDYKREVILSDDEIKADLNKMLEWIAYSKENGCYGDVSHYENRVRYFVDGVRFFNSKLADELNYQYSLKAC